MFSQHELNRKRRRRAMFFVLCVAPTLATLAFVAVKLRPGRDARWGRAEATSLLTPVTLAETAEPRPGVARCARATIGNAVQLLDVVVQQRAGRSAVHVARAEVTAAQLGRLAERAAAWLADEQLACDALIDELVLVEARPVAASNQPEGHALRDPGSRGDAAHSDVAAGASSWRLRDVHVRLRRETDDDVVVRRLEIAGVPATDGDMHEPSARLQIMVERRVTDGGTALSVTVDSTASDIPGWVATAWPWPLGRREEATFRGRWQLAFADTELETGEFRGSVRHVDAGRCLPPGTQHQLTGSADWTEAEVRWSDRGVGSLAGRIEIAGGRCSASLVQAAIDPLTCRLADEAAGGVAEAPPGELFEFDRLACRFTFNAAGLTIDGACGDEGTAPRVLVARRGQPWLLEPTYTNVHAGTWVRMLSPAAGSWLAATREAVEVARAVPLPQSAAPQ